MKRWLALFVLGTLGCDKPEPPAPPPAIPQPKVEPQPKPDPRSTGQPGRISVQHLLIGFQGSMPKPVPRSKEEAEKLAMKLFERAKKGENFSALTMSFSDDSPDGVYTMSNFGVEPAGPEEFAREVMAPSFGDVSFQLQVGEIGIANYDPKKSPFGWHIIKRLK